MKVFLEDAVEVKEMAETQRDKEFDYLLGFYHHVEGVEDRNAYKIISAPFACAENAEYNGV